MIYPFNTASCFDTSTICPPCCNNNTTYLLDADCLLADLVANLETIPKESCEHIWAFACYAM